MVCTELQNNVDSLHSRIALPNTSYAVLPAAVEQWQTWYSQSSCQQCAPGPPHRNLEIKLWRRITHIAIWWALMPGGRLLAIRVCGDIQTFTLMCVWKTMYINSTYLCVRRFSHNHFAREPGKHNTIGKPRAESVVGTAWDHTTHWANKHRKWYLELALLLIWQWVLEHSW